MNSNLAEEFAKEFAKANAISSEMSPEEAAETTPPPPRAHRKQPTKQATMNKKNPIQVDDEEETEETARAIQPNRPVSPLPPAPPATPAATSPVPILSGAASGSEKNEKKKRKRVRFVDDEPGQVTEPVAAPPAPAAPTEKKRKPNPNPSRGPRCESSDSDTERKQLWSRDVRKYREGGPFYKCGVVISIKRDKGKGKFSGTVVVDVKREHVKRAQTAQHSQPMRGILSRAVTLRDHL